MLEVGLLNHDLFDLGGAGDWVLLLVGSRFSLLLCPLIELFVFFKVCFDLSEAIFILHIGLFVK